MNLGMDVVYEAVPDIVLPVSFSREQLEDTLARQPCGVLAFSEFAEFLQKGRRRDYMAGTKELLTDLFDSPQKRPTSYKGSGNKVIERAAPTILAATTMQWLEQSIEEADIQGGFLARFLLCRGGGTRSYVSPAGGSAQVPPNLVHALQGIGNAKGQADFSAVQVLFDQLLQNYEAQLARRSLDPLLDGVYSRSGIYLLKLSTLFMLSRTGGANLTVADEDVLRALAVVQYSHDQFEGLSLAFTRDERVLRQLRQLIGANPGITRRDILRALDMRVRDVDQYVATLEASGEIAVQSARLPGGVRISYSPTAILGKRLAP